MHWSDGRNKRCCGDIMQDAHCCMQLCAPSGSSPGNTALTSLECLLGHSARINPIQKMQTSNATGCALHTAARLNGRLAVHIPTIVYSRPHVVPTVADAAIQACYVYGLDGPNDA